MKRYHVTPQAREDLRAIIEYIAQDNLSAARAVFTEISKSFRKIANSPGIGHVRDDIVDESLRAWPVYAYLIIYRAEVRPLQIVRILHGARDVQSVLDSDE